MGRVAIWILGEVKDKRLCDKARGFHPSRLALHQRPTRELGGHAEQDKSSQRLFNRGISELVAEEALSAHMLRSEKATTNPWGLEALLPAKLSSIKRDRAQPDTSADSGRGAWRCGAQRLAGHRPGRTLMVLPQQVRKSTMTPRT